jgi:hypothetical protein
MTNHPQTSPSRIPGMTPSSDSLALLAEIQRSLEGTQDALLSKDRKRLEELTANQRLLLEALCVLNVAADEGLRAKAAQVLQLGRTQLAILRRSLQMLRAIFNFRAGIQSTYEAKPGSQGVVVGQSNAYREA